MALETMQIDSVDDGDEETESYDILAEHAEELVYKVWGGDWCKECRKELPAFSRALANAGVPEDRVELYPVEKDVDGSKVGPLVDEYDVERIPTVVIHHEGERIARFVEEESAPIAEYLEAQIRDAVQ